MYLIRVEICTIDVIDLSKSRYHNIETGSISYRKSYPFLGGFSKYLPLDPRSVLMLLTRLVNNP